MKDKIFEDLFVLELANNHWGSVERGKEIVRAFSDVIKKYNVKASIKLQFRDVDNFIHKGFREITGFRYITKTLATKLTDEQNLELAQEVRNEGLIVMSTPFDEKSVDLCMQAGVDIIKIASSDINDWILIDKIAQTRKPVIVSTGGASLEDVDKVVDYFNSKDIPLAINHCVAQYPTEKENLELGQIDFLIKRYPDNVIGYSTHERNERLGDALMMAFAKGARTFERHVDIPNEEHGVSPYCSLPEDIEVWFDAFNRAKAMNGEDSLHRRMIPKKETEYLDALVRGAYLKRDIRAGEVLTKEDVYFAIPLQKGQISCREFAPGLKIQKDVLKDESLNLENYDSSYLEESYRKMVLERGL